MAEKSASRAKRVAPTIDDIASGIASIPGSVKPITFGVKLYLSYKFVVWGKNRMNSHRNAPACLSLELPP